MASGPLKIEYHDCIGKTASGICQKRKLLLRKLTGALEEVLSLYRQEHDAMLADDPKFTRFDPMIERRLKKAQAALDAYSRHVKGHGC